MLSNKFTKGFATAFSIFSTFTTFTNNSCENICTANGDGEEEFANISWLFDVFNKDSNFFINCFSNIKTFLNNVENLDDIHVHKYTTPTEKKMVIININNKNNKNNKNPYTNNKEDAYSILKWLFDMPNKSPKFFAMLFSNIKDFFPNVDDFVTVHTEIDHTPNTNRQISITCKKTEKNKENNSISALELQNLALPKKNEDFQKNVLKLKSVLSDLTLLRGFHNKICNLCKILPKYNIFLDKIKYRKNEIENIAKITSKIRRYKMEKCNIYQYIDYLYGKESKNVIEKYVTIFLDKFKNPTDGDILKFFNENKDIKSLFLKKIKSEKQINPILEYFKLAIEVGINKLRKAKNTLEEKDKLFLKITDVSFNLVFSYLDEARNARDAVDRNVPDFLSKFVDPTYEDILKFFKENKEMIKFLEKKFNGESTNKDNLIKKDPLFQYFKLKIETEKIFENKTAIKKVEKICSNIEHYYGKQTLELVDQCVIDFFSKFKTPDIGDILKFFEEDIRMRKITENSKGTNLLLSFNKGLNLLMNEIKNDPLFKYFKLLNEAKKEIDIKNFKEILLLPRINENKENVDIKIKEIAKGVYSLTSEIHKLMMSDQKIFPNHEEYTSDFIEWVEKEIKIEKERNEEMKSSFFPSLGRYYGEQRDKFFNNERGQRNKFPKNDNETFLDYGRRLFLKVLDEQLDKLIEEMFGSEGFLEKFELNFINKDENKEIEELVKLIKTFLVDSPESFREKIIQPDYKELLKITSKIEEIYKKFENLKLEKMEILAKELDSSNKINLDSFNVAHY